MVGYFFQPNQVNSTQVLYIQQSDSEEHFEYPVFYLLFA